MGFEKWVYRNGFGSPGHTARTLVNWYHKVKNEVDFLSEEDIYSSVYQMRRTIQHKLNNNNSLLDNFIEDMILIIAYNDMPLFVFAVIILESNKFRTEITNNNINKILEVIREEVIKSDRSLISLQNNDYHNMAIEFFNQVYQYSEFK